MHLNRGGGLRRPPLNLNIVAQRVPLFKYNPVPKILVLAVVMAALGASSHLTQDHLAPAAFPASPGDDSGGTEAEV